MIVVLQRVLDAKVNIDKENIASINKGLLLLIGVTDDDTKLDIEKLIRKIPYLRIFEDNNEKMNFSLLDTDGEVLVVPNFTLLADCKKGRRPSFCKAGEPSYSKMLFDDFCNEFDKTFPKKVQRGSFGADMKVSLTNDGPVTIVLDSKKL